MKPILIEKHRHFQGQVSHLAHWMSGSVALGLRTALTVSLESFEPTDQLPRWIDWRQVLS